MIFREVGTTSTDSAVLAARALVAARLGLPADSPDVATALLRASSAVSVYCGRPMWHHVVEERLPRAINIARGVVNEYSLGCWPVGRIVAASDEYDFAAQSPWTLFSIWGRDRSVLMREPSQTFWPTKIQYSAGFLRNESQITWAPESQISAGSWIDLGQVRMVALSAGATGANPPIWPTQPSVEIVDGSVTWVGDMAVAPSVGQQEAVAVLAEQMHLGLFDEARYGVIAESGPAGYVGYSPETSQSIADAMPRPVRVEWSRWRSYGR